MRTGEGEVGGVGAARQLPRQAGSSSAVENFGGDRPSAVSLPTRADLRPPRVALRQLEAPLVPSKQVPSEVGSAWLQSLVPQQVSEGTVPSFLHTIAGDIEAAKDFWM